MKIKISSLPCIGTLLVAGALAGSAASVITIDENKSGNIDGTPLPAQQIADPTPNEIHTNVLSYGPLSLTGAVTGDVKIFAGPSPAAVIRFTADSSGNKLILFYAAPGSALPNDPLARLNDNSIATQDSPNNVPPLPVSNTVQLAFTGAIMKYTPTAGQPGFDPSGPIYMFLFSSTAAPTSIVNPAGSNLEGAYQISYASELNSSDAVVNILNTGAAASSTAPNSSNTAGDICVNAYVYQPSEQLLACCSCPTTPNSLHSWPVIYGAQALLANSATKPSSVVIKLVSTSPASGSTPANPICDASFQNAPFTLVPGLTARATHPHLTPSSNVAITETEFTDKALSVGEASKLKSDCTNLGSAGRCPGCLTGGLAVPEP